MEKGSFSEFTGSGHSRAEFADRLKKSFDDQRISVAGDFDQILACVRLRIRPISDHGLVQILILKLKSKG
jgi:hypothetical protein